MIEMLLMNLNSAGGPVGTKIFDTVGTFSWVCPSDVSEINCMLISPGQSSHYHNTLGKQIAGAGGGVRYMNNIPVIGGRTYTIIIGEPKQNPLTPETDNPVSAFGISVQSGKQGTPFSDTIRGGYGGPGLDVAANSFNQGGCYGGFSGIAGNGTVIPGYSSSPNLGGSGYDYIKNSRSATITKNGADYGGGGGGQQGKGGKGLVCIRWGQDTAFP